MFEVPFNSIEEISDDQLVELHRKYWNYIANKQLNTKPTICGKDGKLLHVSSSCFLCEFARRHTPPNRGLKDCEYCPAKFYKVFAEGSGCLGNLYHRWSDAYDIEDITKYARKIANIPMRKYFLWRMKMFGR